MTATAPAGKGRIMGRVMGPLGRVVPKKSGAPKGPAPIAF